jgi:hypothetical protein
LPSERSFSRSLESALTVSFFPQSAKLAWSGKENGVKIAFLLDEGPFNGTTGNVCWPT